MGKLFDEFMAHRAEALEDWRRTETIAREDEATAEVEAIIRTRAKIALALRNSLVMLIAYLDTTAHLALYGETEIGRILDELDPECPGYEPDTMFRNYEEGINIVSNFPPV